MIGIKTYILSEINRKEQTPILTSESLSIVMEEKEKLEHKEIEARYWFNKINTLMRKYTVILNEDGIKYSVLLKFSKIRKYSDNKFIMNAMGIRKWNIMYYYRSIFYDKIINHYDVPNKFAIMLKDNVMDNFRYPISYKIHDVKLRNPYWR